MRDLAISCHFVAQLQVQLLAPLLHYFAKVLQSSFYWTQVFLGSDLWVRVSQTHSMTLSFADLIDVTLADEDTNSILTDNVNRAIQGNMVMQIISWLTTLELMLWNYRV